MQIEGVPLLGCDADQVVSEFRVGDKPSIFQTVSWFLIEFTREV